MKRLAILRFSHEGNSFSPVPTTRGDFLRCEWLKGEPSARAAYAGTRTEIGAVIDLLAARPDWHGEFLRCAAAPPGGPVEDALIEAVIGEAVADLSGGAWDAIYVSLHGAMVGATRLQPDLDLLRAIRQAIGPDCPLAVSFDLHANMALEIADTIDIAIGYKTYPHIDCYETAAKALGLLLRAASGEIAPAVTVAKSGCVLLSHNMRTQAGPMAAIETFAARLEGEYGLFDATPFGGFTFGDSPHAGASACVTAPRDGAAGAADAARRLAAAIADRRQEFVPDMPLPEAALRRVLREARPGLVALVEPADNPMSGGIGDTPALFAAMLAARPDVPCLFAFFCDPDLVARAHAAGKGAHLEARFGGRLTTIYGPPVAASVRVASLTDGHFVNDGPMARGMAVDLGRTAVLDIVDCPAFSIIVTEACVSPNDHAYFRLHGIDLRQMRLLCAKAKNHFRAAFAADCIEIVDVDTPGPATADPASLPFRHVPAAMLPPARGDRDQRSSTA